MGAERIKNLMAEERPREKLFSLGTHNLTETELLAILINSGGRNKSALQISRELLRKHGNLHGVLGAEPEQLQEFSYVGKAKVAAIKAVYEIVSRVRNPKPQGHIYVRSPQDVYVILRKEVYRKNKEYIFLLTLDARSKLISKDLLSIGTLNEALIHPREVFKQALSKNAYSIVLAHNHPSANIEPSDEDIKVTARISAVGRDIGINLVDHLILNETTYCSMKSCGLL